MSCASLGCQPRDFEFKWILSPSYRSAASRPIGMRGKGVQFSNGLGFAPQAIAYRASSTKERNFKKRKRGICNNLGSISRSRIGFGFFATIRMESVVVGAGLLKTGRLRSAVKNCNAAATKRLILTLNWTNARGGGRDESGGVSGDGIGQPRRAYCSKGRANSSKNRDYSSKNSLAGSSVTSLIVLKKPTASRPSTIR